MIQAPVTYRLVAVTVGNLFSVAAQYMNDATRWNEIASLNNMLDPWFYTPMMLKIPTPVGNGNGGVLGL
jgi:hypothetical protein